MLYTDGPGVSPPGYLPDGVREVDFASASGRMPEEHWQQALVSLLRSFHADAIVNVESSALYRALTPYGKALAASDRVFLCFLGNQQQTQGNWDGWGLRWLYAGFDFAEGFITDSDHLRDQLTDLYQLSEADRERIHVLPAPVDTGLPRRSAPTASSRRPVVAWAGRADWHGRIDIAVAVARRMPEADFRFFCDVGLPVEPAEGIPGNVRVEGPYDHLGVLDLSSIDAWLYTSAWDGVPSVLLDVAMAEIPVVGGLVGSVGEVLRAEESWPVASWEDPGAYASAIREVLSDAQAACARARALRERLARDRPVHAFGERAAELLLVHTESTEEPR